MTKLQSATVEEQLKEMAFIEHFRELTKRTKHLKNGMLTTLSASGRIHSAPMRTFAIEDDYLIWMFASKDSESVKNIILNGDCMLNYADQETFLYVSINAHGEISTSTAEIDRLWKDKYTSWFPYGKTDPNLCMIKLSPERAEYWDNPDNGISQIFSIVKNVLKGEAPTEGENKVLNFGEGK